jgi:hypothetical protein
VCCLQKDPKYVVYKQATKMSETFEAKFDLLMNPPSSESESDSDQEDTGVDEEGEESREIDELNYRLAAGRRMSGKDTGNSQDWGGLARWLRKPLFDTCVMEIGDDEEVVSVARGLDVNSVRLQLEETLCEDEDISDS